MSKSKSTIAKARARTVAKVSTNDNALREFLVESAGIVRGFAYVKNPLGQFYQRPNEQITTAKIDVPWRKTPFVYKAEQNYHIAVDPERPSERGRHAGPKFHQALEQNRISDTNLHNLALDMLVWSVRKLMTGREQSSEAIMCALIVDQGERVGLHVDSLDVGRGRTFTREQIEERIAYLKKYFEEASNAGWLRPKKSTRPMSSAKL